MYKFNKRASLTIIILRKGTCGHINQHAISSRVDPWLLHNPWVFKYKYVHWNLVYKVLRARTVLDRRNSRWTNLHWFYWKLTRKHLKHYTTHQQYFTVALLLFCTEGIYFKMYTVDCLSLVTIEGVPDKRGFTVYNNLGNVIILLLLSVRM